ncbi:phosphatase PAP2 family protein [Chitinophagaceae bacterium LWZ2-11]
MSTLVKEKSFFSPQTLLSTSVISIAYLLLSAWLVGFKSDQVILVLIFNALFYTSGITRKFIIGFSVFIVFWILFDYMKAFPNYKYNTVHIESLYNAEKDLFGIGEGLNTVTPNEYWLSHNKPALDVITGFFYLCWMPVPLFFAAYLFYAKRLNFLHFALTFLFVNCVGFVVYYTYPAAPPWYVQQYGFDFHASTPGNTAGLARFDHFFNVEIFKGLYSKSSNVFAAMPSLHSAYPFVVLYYAFKSKLNTWAILFFAIVMVGIWFAAVYNSHHYVLDVIAGVLCAIIGIVLYNKVLMTRLWFNKFISKFYEKIR